MISLDDDEFDHFFGKGGQRPHCDVTGLSCQAQEYLLVHGGALLLQGFQAMKNHGFSPRIIAAEHLGAKFLRIGNTKAPFFVQKLHIKMLSVLFLFKE